MSKAERINKFIGDFEERFKDKTARLERNGETVHARFVGTRKALGKFAHEGPNGSDNAGYRAKMRLLADGDIISIVENSEYKSSDLDIGKEGKAHKYINRWDYFYKTVIVDGKGYDIIINVRNIVPKSNANTEQSFVYSMNFYENNDVDTNVAKEKSKVRYALDLYSETDGESVVDLTSDNELSRIIGNTRGAEKYKKIQNYILDILRNQPIRLSDGKFAIVDRRDALHIAKKSGYEKMAQISKIKEIVERAKLYAEDKNVEHNKFDYFCYYKANVRYKTETISLYLNVGRSINEGKYHIYDITKKIRDTANRIIGLERPKPNEGYAIENDVSTTIIPEKSEKSNGFNEKTLEKTLDFEKSNKKYVLPDDFDPEKIIERGVGYTQGRVSKTVGEMRKLKANATRSKVYSKKNALCVIRGLPEKRIIYHRIFPQIRLPCYLSNCRAKRVNSFRSA